MLDLVADGQPYETPFSGALEGYASRPPTFGEHMQALAADASTTAPIARKMQRAQYASDPVAEAARAGIDETLAFRPIAERPVTMLDADTANKNYPGADGSKLFDGPVPEPVAQSIARAKRDEADREDILRRGAATHYWPTNFAMGLVGQMMDPLNLATAFLPGIGEEAVAARLGGGFVARMAGRAAAGGTAGAAGMVPLTALHYGLGLEERSDYGLRDAFRDMMFGAAAGAILHAGFGTARELLRGGPPRPPEAPPAVPGAEPGAEAATAPPAAPAPPPVVPEAPVRMDPVTGRVFVGDRDVTNEPFMPYAQGQALTGADAPAKAAAMETAVSQLLTGRPLDVMPVVSASSWRLMSEEAALRANDRELAEFQAGLEIHPEAAAAQDRLTRIEQAERQLQAPEVTPEQRGALEERRDELRRGVDIETLRERAAAAEIGRQTEAQRARIAERLGEIEAERARARLGAIASDLPAELRPPDLSISKVAQDQQTLYRNGFASGVPQAEFDRAKAEIYGPKEAENLTNVARENIGVTRPEGAVQAAPGHVREVPGGAAREGAALVPEVPRQPHAEPAKPGETVIDPEIAAAEHALAGKELHPEDTAEIAAASAKQETADLHGQAMAEAAICLKTGE